MEKERKKAKRSTASAAAGALIFTAGAAMLCFSVISSGLTGKRNREEFNAYSYTAGDAAALSVSDELHDERRGLIGWLGIETGKVNIHYPVYAQDDDEMTEKYLSMGAVWCADTGFPGEGRTLIMAHNGLIGKELFEHIDMLEDGDEAVIKLGGRELVYRFKDSRIVRPEEVCLKENEDLVLMSCYPFGSNEYRYLAVFCEAGRCSAPGGSL